MKSRIVLAVINDLTYDRRMDRICSSLADAGAEVTLIGRRLRDSKSFHRKNFIGRRFRCLFNKGFLFYAEYNIRLFIFLLFTAFDVACACDLDTVLAVRLACFFKRKKSVYDAHEYFTEVPEIKSRPAVKSIWEWIGRVTVPKFNLCYTVGEELADRIGKKYKTHFHVIRNISPQSNTIHSGKGLEDRENILLYQGALNVGRGLQTCIKAMVRLPDWKLWLAGEGDITIQLKKLAADIGVGERVVFFGWVQPEELPGLLGKAKINVNLLEADSLNYFYSLPNKFFDALNAGLPSITMKFPEYERICIQYPCALLVEEVSVTQLVEAVNYLDKNPEQWKAMSAACLQASKEYTWEKESWKLIQLYQDLMREIN